MVEAMIATLVLAFLALSIFTGLIFSYKLAAKTRYRDHARYILKSIGDEFLTRQAENKLGNFNPLFEPTPTGPTGDGVFWNGVVGTSGDTAGLQVTLGTSTGALITNARVTRDVRYLSNSGTVTDTPPAGTAGIMLRGDFRIRYVFDNIPVEQNVSLVRRVP